MSSSGKLLGVIDISGDHRSRHPHTLGLVGMAARMIENRLVLASCQRHTRLHLHAHPEGIGSVAEGIIALSEEGWVVGANRTGLEMLHLSPNDIDSVKISDVLDVPLDELLLQNPHGVMSRQIHLYDGTPMFMQVYAVAGTIVSASPVSPPVDALSRLDRGDPLWHSATDKARRVAGKPIPLLLYGESGVGKELFARAVHESGPRRDKPFIAINCGALPENLIEAELFGYAPGAYTGARRDGYIGRLREALVACIARTPCDTDRRRKNS
jgi:sigma-54 dependent transcriptional regulator, acetoin dehydrogenase operon transcriptional activator AcoR